jgi:uncharacterized protein
MKLSSMNGEVPPARRRSHAGGIILLLALGATACGASENEERDVDPAGIWLGSLEAADSSLRLVFTVSAPGPSGRTGTLDVPEQGYIGGVLSRIEVKRRQVVLEVADLGLRFSGDVDAETDATPDAGAQSITGVFTQAGETLPLILRKQTSRPDYRRPQDPRPPFPYESRDVTFANEEAGITLAGTLAVPPGPGPFKAVVLIAGSGPHRRDEEIWNHRPFLVLADALARAGLVTLRYDKRGVGLSQGNYEAATSLNFAADARAAVRFLRRQSALPLSSVGLAGHSEGGTIAPLVAEGNPDVAFLVLLAGTAVPGAEVLVSQHRAISAAEGVPAAEIDADEALDRMLYACFRAESAAADVDRCLRPVLAAGGISGPAQDTTVAGLNTPWMRTFVVTDPTPVLAHTTIPVLALAGGLDLQVLPSLNLPPLRKALTAAGNQRATVEELIGLNHLFQHATTGSPTEYGTISETMAPEVLARVSTWITGL